jgi:hypothetical protein
MIMEVGHISQAALLCAIAEGIDSFCAFCTSALREEMVKDRIQLHALDETPALGSWAGSCKNTNWRANKITWLLGTLVLIS